VHPKDDLGDVTLPVSLGEWFLSFYDEHRELMVRQERRRKKLAAVVAENGQPPHSPPLGAIECTVGPGELIFVPHGWWHCVLNLDRSVALTQNYVSSSNLSSVLHFLKDKQDHISGVRDRPDAIAPSKLHAVFVEALAEAHPKLLAELERDDRVRCEAALASNPQQQIQLQLEKQQKQQKGKKRKKTQQPTMWEDLVSESHTAADSSSEKQSGFSFGF
jgi:hypothetical protein